MTARVFALCAPEDGALATELGRHLAALKSDGSIALHRSDTLSAEEQVAQVRAADLVLVLLTPSFIDSPLWRGAALQEVVEQKKERDLRVIPFRMEPCDLTNSQFEAVVSLPRGQHALSESRDRMREWFDIAREIRRVVGSLRRA